MASIGVVQGITGTVTVKTADGKIKELKAGDTLSEGDQIQSSDGQVNIQLANGQMMTVLPGQSMAMNAGLLANTTEEETGEEGDAESELVEALLAGEDSSELFQAPAAGENASDSASEPLPESPTTNTQDNIVERETPDSLSTDEESIENILTDIEDTRSSAEATLAQAQASTNAITADAEETVIVAPTVATPSEAAPVEPEAPAVIRPTITSESAETFTEQAVSVGAVVANFTASSDVSEDFQYSLTRGNEQNYFAIDKNTGTVTLTQAGVNAVNSDAGIDLKQLSLGVTVNDGTANSAESSVTVSVDRINDNAPTIDSTTGLELVDNQASANDVVARIAASDVDDGSTLTYAITQGNTNGYFSINPQTGDVSLTQAGADAVNSPEVTDLTDFALKVTATDGTYTSSETPVFIDVTKVNLFAPIIDTAVPTDTAFVEESVYAGQHVAAFTASDLDGNATIHFNLASGNDNGYFAINSSTGVVTLTQAGANAINNDGLGADLTQLPLGVTATDGKFTTSLSEVVIDITRINDKAPIIDASTGFTVAEGSVGVGSRVATFTFADHDDGDAVSYAISSGNQAGYFTINAATGDVTLTQTGVNAINNDAGIDLTQLTVGVIATDGTNTSSESTATFDITRINDHAPVIDATTGGIIAGNAIVAGNVVANVYASDLDDATAFQYSIVSGNNQGLFTINSQTGEVILTQAGVNAFNANGAQEGLQLGVIASDGTTTTSPSYIDISLGEINENTPTFDLASGSTILETGLSVDTVVANFSASDLDVGDTLSYRISSGNDAGYFSINTSSGQVTLTQAGVDAISSDSGIDITSLQLGVTATDGVNLSEEASVTVSVGRLNDNAPMVIASAGNDLTEGSVNTGDVVATMMATDLDDTDTVSYRLTSGNDSGYFTIDTVTGEVTLTQAGVNAVNTDGVGELTELTLGITASDGANDAPETVITVDVTRVNQHAPVFTLEEGSQISEHEISVGQVVAEFTASDMDDSDTLTYSLTSGNESGYFSLDSSTGVVTLTQVGVDAINDDSVQELTHIALGVTVSDGVNTTPESVVDIDITRINENDPTIDITSPEALTEQDVSSGTLVATFTASDLSDSDSANYDITSGNNLGYFSIDPTNGKVRLTPAGVAAINRDTGPELQEMTIGVTANDQYSTSQEVQLTIDVTRVNDNAPVIDSNPEVKSFTENRFAAGNLVASFTASDLDDGNEISFHLSSGNDEGYFFMDAATGKVYLTQDGVDALNSDSGEDISAWNLGIVASDGVNHSIESHVTIDITRVNDNAPTIDTADGFERTEVAENQVNVGDVVARFVASDFDDDDILQFEFSSGHDSGYFSLDTATGEVSLTQAGVDAINSDEGVDLTQLSVGVVASDGTNRSFEAQTTIDITRTNDTAPTVDAAEPYEVIEHTVEAGDVVATFTATDVDDVDSISYRLTSGNASGYFTIDEASGEVFITEAGVNAINDDTALDIQSLTIGVKASDGVNDSIEQGLTIDITRVNDHAPEMNLPTQETLTEGAIQVGDIVAIFTADDLDDQDSISYHINSGNESNYFSIDSHTGIVRLTQEGVDAINDDYSIDLTALQLGVVASDGGHTTPESSITVDIERVNDTAPTIDTTINRTVTENDVAVGDVVARFAASDLDDGTTLSFRLSSGNNRGYFEIDESTGAILLTDAGVNAINRDVGFDLNEISLGVTVSDGVNDSAETPVTIDITRVNDNAPTLDPLGIARVSETDIEAGDVVATFIASDLDDADTLTFSLTSGNQLGYFEIDESTGAVSVTQAGVDAIASDIGVEITALNLGVTVSDGTNATEEVPVTVHVDRVNDNAPVITTEAGSQVTENVITAGTMVAAFTATDLDDGNVVNFSITTGNENNYFDIDTETGAVRINQTGVDAINSDDGLDLNTLQLGVTATDGLNNSSESFVDIDITRVNDNAPTIDSTTGLPVTEESVTAGDVVAIIAASDLDDADTLSYTITRGNEQNFYTIDAATGEVRLTQEAVDAINSDAVELSELTLGVTVSDGTTTSEEAPVTININRVNDNAPTIEATPPDAITEGDIASGDIVASFTASDMDDADTITYSITTGNENGYFSMDVATGQVYLNQTGVDAINSDEGLDVNQLTLGVTASDGERQSPESVVTIDIHRVNDTAPVFDTGEGSTVTEGSLNVGDVVATFSASDSDDLSVVGYRITSGNESAYFDINPINGTVTLTQAGVDAFNSDTDSDITRYPIGVTANDGVNDSEEMTVAINVERINDNAPTVDVADGLTVEEGVLRPGDLVATFSASDRDDSDTLEFSLVSGNDNNYFVIDPQSGEVRVTFAGAEVINSDDGVDTSQLTLGVQVSDGEFYSETAMATVDITRVNDNAPEIDSAISQGVTEGEVSAGDLVAAFAAMDLDDVDNITYNLTSGNDANYFFINEQTGEVRLTPIGVNALNSDSGHDLTQLIIGVTASDGVNTSQESVVILDITRVNDSAPRIELATGSIVEENAINAGDVVATVTASDADDGDLVTFSLSSGNEEGYFSIHPETGEVRLTQLGVDAINSDDGVDINQLTLGVTATDGTYNSAQSLINIDITRVNDSAPTIDTELGSEVTEEGIEAGDLVATFTASDLDDVSTLTYSLTSGNDEGYFTINELTGEVRLTQLAVDAINNDEMSDITALPLGVTVSDGVNLSAESVVTVNIQRVNDHAPTIDTSAGSSLTENAVNVGDLVATFAASDVDDQNSLTYRLSSGNDDGYYSIDESAGEVRLTQAGIDAINSDEGLDTHALTLGVTVNDGEHDSPEVQATLDITRVNDTAPTFDTTEGITLTEGSITAGTLVASFVATDLDDDSEVMYTITRGNDFGQFSINPYTGEIRLNQQAVDEFNNDEGVDITAWELAVTASDGINISEEAVVTIDIDRINDNAPVIDTATGSEVAENAMNVGDVVAVFAASDIDDADTMSYRLSTGNDDGYFTITSDTGEVSLTQAGIDAFNSDTGPDLDNWEIGVTAFDGENDSVESRVMIDISRVNDNAPVIDTATSDGVTENAIAEGDVVATFVANDFDDDDVLTYTLGSGNQLGYFTIDASTGEVKLTQTGVDAINDDEALDVNSLTVGVVASDGAHSSPEVPVTIDITRVNDSAPVIDIAQGTGIEENSIVPGTLVAAFSAVDADDVDVITYHLTTGNDEGYFVMHPMTGEVRLTQAGVDAFNSDDGPDLNEWTIGITANDGVNDSIEEVMTLDITRVNDNAPVIDTALNIGVTENLISAGDVVAVITASDADDIDSVTYELTRGNDEGYFSIHPQTGQVSISQEGVDAINSDEGTDLTAWDLGITATDGTYSSEETTFTIDINRVNDTAPTVSAELGSAIKESLMVEGTLVATFTATDLDDVDTVSYSLSSGNESGYFTIDADNGEVRLTQAGVDAINSDEGLDITGLPIGVTASDGLNASQELMLTLDVSRVNDNAPLVDTSTGSEITEGDVAAGDVVARFTASDLDDAEPLVFSLSSGNTQGYFAIDASTGDVSLTQAGIDAINSDAATDILSLPLGIVVSDGVHTTAESAVFVNIHRINDNAPTIDASNPYGVTENAMSEGDVVATFVASDLDDASTVTYSLTEGNENNYFTIDENTGVVTLTQTGVDAFNSDDADDLLNYTLGVTASDEDGQLSEQSAVTIDITRVNDNAPVFDVTEGSTVVESGITAGDVVATFVASDSDYADVINYRISSGNDEGYFAIDSASGEVSLTQAGVDAINSDDALDLTALTLGVIASDGLNESPQASVPVNITRINDNAPTIDTATGSTVVEGSMNVGDVVATVVASDLDDVDTLTFSLSSGNDEGYFAIDVNSGEVSLTQAGVDAFNDDSAVDLDQWALGITTSDGTLMSEESLMTVDVTRINDNAPVIDMHMPMDVAESAVSIGTVVAMFMASDVDDDDGLTFRLTSGNDDNYFAIDELTGMVTLTAEGVEAINSDVGVDLNSLSLGVTANDGNHDSPESTVTFNIARINDHAPVIDVPLGSTVVETDVSVGDVVATFVASDWDDVDVVSYRLTSGNELHLFAIDSATGEVSLTQAGVDAIENDVGIDLTRLMVGVTASDGERDSAESYALVNITRVNDRAPVIDTATGSTVVEESVNAGDVVATFVASDHDDVDVVTYSLTSGNALGYVAIDTATGTITLTQAGVDAINSDDGADINQLSLSVIASDGVNQSMISPVTINVTRINENAPVFDTEEGRTITEESIGVDTVVAVFGASDVDDTSVISYRLSSGNDEGYFTIDSDTGVVTLSQQGVDAINSDDGLDINGLSLGVTANDGENDAVESVVNVNINRVNDTAPVIDTDLSAGSTVTENALNAGDLVATFAASDLDDTSVLSYSITQGNELNFFMIDPTSGDVRLTQFGVDAINHDAADIDIAQLTLGITVSDGVNLSTETTVTVDVTRVNDNAPTIDDHLEYMVTENNVAVGDIVATFTASDLDDLTDITFSLTSGNDLGYFSISETTGDVMLTEAGVNAVNSDDGVDITQFIVGVTATDGALNSSETLATVNVIQTNDNAPVIDTAEGSQVEEGSIHVGLVVATFVASDLDDTDIITYRLSSGNDEGYFVIDPDTGTVTLTVEGVTAINNDQLVDIDLLTLGVTASDGVHDSVESPVNVNITRVNDNAPEIVSAPVNPVIEGTLSEGDVVAIFTATDLDDDDSLSYSISSGNDEGYFAIDSLTGSVSLTQVGVDALESDDAVDINSLNLGVTAFDGENASAEMVVPVAIDRINDNAPVIAIDPATDNTVIENTLAAGDLVASFIASDLDDADTLTFSITTGNDFGYFAIDTSTGDIRLNQSAVDLFNNDEGVDLTAWDLGVTVSDGEHTTTVVPVTIDITRVNDIAPVVGTAIGEVITENSITVGSKIAAFVASDLDDASVLTYSLSSGNDLNYFTIDENTGEVFITQAGVNAISDDTGVDLAEFVIGVVSHDGIQTSEEKLLTVNINHVNDNAPVVGLAPRGESVIESAVAEGDLVAIFNATDLDDDDVISYEITAGNDAGLVTIDTATGDVFLTQAGVDFINDDAGGGATAFAIGVTATDGRFSTVEMTATIDITRVNDAAVITGEDQGTVVEDTTLTVAGVLAITDSESDEAAFVPETINATYGTLIIDAAGSWSYDANNDDNAIQSLSDSDSLTDVITVRSLDGTEHPVVITINGTNDIPVITGIDTGDLVEDSAALLVVSGVMAISDGDEGEAAFVPETLTGHYGDLVIQSDGNWSYSASSVQSAIQALGENDSVVDTLQVKTIDGTVQDIVITLSGSNDAAIIVSGDTGSVVEDATAVTLTAAGMLVISDTDEGEAEIIPETVVGTYGNLSVDSEGNWSYSADNSQENIQELGEGDHLTDTLQVQSVDGTSHDVVITIQGSNDDAMISGSTTGGVVEDSAEELTATGVLVVADADSNEAVFIAETLTGHYGDLVIQPDGNWSYSASSAQSAIQALGENDSVVDTLQVKTIDGTVQDVVITLSGSNDAAIIVSGDTGSVVEDAAAVTLTAAGMLVISDTDEGEAEIIPETVAGTYGSLSVDSEGNWSYSADNTQENIQALGERDHLTDTLQVQSVDGTLHDVVITIQGSNDQPVITMEESLRFDNLGVAFNFKDTSDVSGNGNTFNFLESATTGEGRDDQSAALTMDGSAGGAEIEGLTTGGAMTVSAWVKYDSFDQSWSRVFDFGDGQEANNILLGHSGYSNGAGFQIFNDSAQIIGSLDVPDFFTLGEWVHVTASVDDTGMMKLYKNGELAGEAQGEVPEEKIRANNYIGKSGFSGDGYLDGEIADFAVFDGILTNSEIKTLYQVNSIDDVVGGALHIAENSSNGTVIGHVNVNDRDANDSLSFSLTDDAGGRFIIDSSTGEISILNTSLLDNSIATSHAVTVAVSDGITTSELVYSVYINPENTAPTLIPSAHAAFDFSDNNTAYTVSYTGSANTNGVGRNEQGTAFEMDGTAGGGEIEGLTTGGAMTVSAWVKYDSFDQSWSRIFDFGDGTAVNNILLGHVGTTNSAGFHIYNENNEVVGVLEIADFFTAGEWMHVTASVDESGIMRIYKNGELAGEAQGVMPEQKVRTNNYLGKDNWSTNIGLDGAIDELGIFSEALTAEQIQGLYSQSAVESLYLSVDEAGDDGTVVGKIVGYDEDNDSLRYQLVDDAGGRFIIDEVTGDIKVTDMDLLDYENESQHTVTVEVSDGDESSTRDYVVLLNNVLDVNENTDANVAIGQIDPVDNISTWVFSLNDDAGGMFTIDSDTGVLRVADGASFNYEVNNQYTVSVSMTNGVTTEIHNHSIFINDINEAPVLFPSTDAAFDFSTNNTPYTVSYTGSANTNGVGRNEEGVAFEMDGTAGGGEIEGLITGGAMTVSSWVKYDDFNESYSRIIDFGDGQANNNIMLGHIGTGNDLFFETYNSSGVSTGLISLDNFFTAGEWVHVTASIDDSGMMRVYKNGELAGEIQGVVPEEKIRTNTYLGKSNWESDGAFDGAIDELGIFSEALTAEQIQALYNHSSVETLLQTVNDAQDDAVVGQVVGMDIDDDNLSYSLIDDAGGRFIIDSESGVVSMTNSELLQLEGEAYYKVTVSVGDGYFLTENDYVINMDDSGNVSFNTNVEQPEIKSTLSISITETVQVNGLSSGLQSEAAITQLRDGGFLAVWHLEENNTHVIKAQRYGYVDGKIDPVGESYQIGTAPSEVGSTVSAPEVSEVENGNIAITWSVFNANNEGSSYMSVLDTDGETVKSETLIANNSYESTDITSLSNNQFAIASVDVDNNYVLKIHIYDADGNEISVSNGSSMGDGSTAWSQPDITPLDNGGFVLSWRESGTKAAKFQMFDASGVATTSVIDHGGSGPSYDSQVIMTELGNGELISLYQAHQTDHIGGSIWIRKWSADATPIKFTSGDFHYDHYLRLSDEFDVISAFDIITTGVDSFFVTWVTNDGEVAGRHYETSGNPLTEKIIFNDVIDYESQNPQAVQLESGEVQIIWTGNNSGELGVHTSSVAGLVGIVEHSESGALVGQVDGIGGMDNAMTYELIDDAGGRFVIESDTGYIRVANSELLNVDNADSHVVRIRATNVAGFTDEQDVVINVSEGNRPQEAIIEITEPSMMENLAAAFDFTNTDDINSDSISLTLTGAANINGSGREDQGTAFEMDGTAGGAEIEGLATGGAMTVSTWVKYDSFDQDWSRIFDFGDGAAVNNILFGHVGTTNSAGFHIYNESNQAVGILEIADFFTAGEWVHVTASIDESGMMRIYKDGELAGEAQGEVPEVKVRANNYIGKDNWSSNVGLDGAIDEMSIFNEALTLDQIRSLSQTGSIKELLDSSIVGDEDTEIALSLNVSMVNAYDTDSLSVTVNGLPEDSILSSGVRNNDGSWTLTQEELTGLTLTPPSNFHGTMSLIIDTVIERDYNELSTESSTPVSIYVVPEAKIEGSGASDILTGTVAHDTLLGYEGGDTLIGGDGDDMLIGGEGNDILTGGSGSDEYIWQAGDDGTSDVIAVDTITDFHTGSGGDVLNIQDLLVGESDDNITDYLELNFNNGNTEIDVKPAGSGAATQKIILENVDLSSLGSETDALNQLLNDGNINFDH